jgi:hypothetical protein
LRAGASWLALVELESELADLHHKEVRHNDLTHLESLLRAAGDRPKFIVFESIYSMDADLAPIGAICEATNFKWAFSRSRLGSARASWLLSIRFVTKLSRAVGAGRAEISMLALCFGKNSFIELPCRRP